MHKCGRFPFEVCEVEGEKISSGKGSLHGYFN